MYNTPEGTRVLQGAERHLFVQSLGMLVDMLSTDDVPTDIPVFDGLTRNQKIATYHAVARALLVKSEPSPTLTAVVEAATASVYQHVFDMISLELDDDDDSDGEDYGFRYLPEGPSWREMTIAAAQHMGLTKLPKADEVDLYRWETLIECLQDRVQWDRDWEMVDHQDAPPELASRVKQEAGIADDYFVAIPPDPQDAETERMLRELKDLTRDAR